jgi:hypothetical protein
MPARETTEWRHAIILKKVINLDHGGAKHVMCAWDTCERDGYENNKVVTRESAPGYPLKTISYVFCSEKHRNYFIDQARGMLPGYLRSGNRGGIL